MVLQSVPVYLSEMAPARLRGMLNIGFQLMITIGILAANLINYGTSKIKGGWGWRLSLGLAAVPAGIITLGSLFLPDTPNSLIERGHADEAMRMLRRIRGTDDIHAEYNDLVAASEEAKLVKHPWRNIVARKYRPQLTMAILIPLFQQFTGSKSQTTLVCHVSKNGPAADMQSTDCTCQDFASFGQTGHNDGVTQGVCTYLAACHSNSLISL